ncbi:MAG: tRNA epoxyqueuosine(34) reductase QueG [Bacteroidales bacterium]|nr:tRNA epoxyqueuosine(34) reductase QueG [Bacteroidales bacterium]
MFINSQIIKDKVEELGFTACGICNIEALYSEQQRFKQWLADGKNANMLYLANSFDKRINPRLIDKHFNSVIMLLAQYRQDIQPADTAYRIARYAYCPDYHCIIKNKIIALEAFLKQINPAIKTLSFTDSSPVMEKIWAVRCGLGNIGKNSLLVHPLYGSFILMGGMLTDLILEPDSPFTKDLCGDCQNCIKSCPAKAIDAEGSHTIDARKCISYKTIEKSSDKSSVQSLQSPVGQSVSTSPGETAKWIFGCDICQEACPYNLKIINKPMPDLIPDPQLLQMTKTDWDNLTEQQFDTLFKDKAVHRTGYKKFMLNIKSNYI